QYRLVYPLWGGEPHDGWGHPCRSEFGLARVDIGDDLLKAECGEALPKNPVRRVGKRRDEQHLRDAEADVLVTVQPTDLLHEVLFDAEVVAPRRRRHGPGLTVCVRVDSTAEPFEVPALVA